MGPLIVAENKKHNNTPSIILDKNNNQFVIAGNLPNYVYNTLIDAFIGWSFLVMVIAILETMTAGLMVRRDRLAQAKSIDRVMRFVLPLIYVIGTALLMLIYTR